MPKCGAKTRAGGTCQRNALKGAKRCALHGGKSTGPKNQRGNKNAARPGSLYSQFLTEEEREIAASMELGSVDEELRVTRIRLMRALRLEEERSDMLEVHETIERTGGGEYAPGDEEKKRVRDYAGLIDKLTSRIESLELRRVQILAIQADTALKRGKNQREGEMHELDIEAKRKAAQMTSGSVTNNIMPVPTADSVESWEAVATAQQDRVLGR
nr:HGGxSTG domain-containing protein [Chromobacterium sp. ASV5]